MGMKIAAVAGDHPGLRGYGLDRYRDHVRSVAATNGYSGIETFSGINSLISTIQGLLDAHNFDCLEELVIIARGNPGASDGIDAGNAASFAAAFKALRLCDEVSLYLNSCNTGINTRGHFCIAQIVSAAGPTVANDNIRLTVYGSVGYVRGTRVDGSAKASGDRLAAGIYGAGYPRGYPDAPDASGNPGVSVGSHDAVGDAVWRGYREGRRIR
jgi:hypothetical protein